MGKLFDEAGPKELVKVWKVGVEDRNPAWTVTVGASEAETSKRTEIFLLLFRPVTPVLASRHSPTLSVLSESRALPLLSVRSQPRHPEFSSNKNVSTTSNQHYRVMSHEVLGKAVGRRSVLATFSEKVLSTVLVERTNGGQQWATEEKHNFIGKPKCYFCCKMLKFRKIEFQNGSSWEG